MDGTIVAQPNNFKPKLSYALSVALVTPIGVVPAMLLILILKSSFSPNHPWPLYVIISGFVIGLIPGFVFGLWLAKRSIDRLYWKLTDTELSGGIFKQQKFLLSSIEKIIVGLPPANAIVKILQKAKPGTALGTTVDILGAVQPAYNIARISAIANAIKENSLLICFQDGSWLPLRLYGLPNGLALMGALKQRCKDRVVDSYNFSTEELQRLRRRDANELNPAPKN
jgi:hypothetical protein